ncbi:hypothetical protein EVAR_35737_1 [Eumeta japonica]|uniref:Uncharacterized protein n=1 Tax=Eumeta variegata TaxID=151549 RepID=A0A4C1VF97_EUMVA|nr:hypothetical protein EVAR_35737_1 [Eumeta japonica]
MRRERYEEGSKGTRTKMGFKIGSRSVSDLGQYTARDSLSIRKDPRAEASKQIRQHCRRPIVVLFGVTKRLIAIRTSRRGPNAPALGGAAAAPATAPTTVHCGPELARVEVTLRSRGRSVRNRVSGTRRTRHEASSTTVILDVDMDGTTFFEITGTVTFRWEILIFFGKSPDPL